MQRSTLRGREGATGGQSAVALIDAFHQMALGLGRLLEAILLQGQEVDRRQEEAERRHQESARRQEQEAERKLQEAIVLQERKAAITLRQAVGQMEIKLQEKDDAIRALQQRLGEIVVGEAAAEGRAEGLKVTGDEGALRQLEEAQVGVVKEGVGAVKGRSEGLQEAAKTEALCRLEGRMQAMEASLQRTLQEFFPRVNGLLQQLGETLPEGATSLPSPSSSDGKTSQKEGNDWQKISPRWSAFSLPSSSTFTSSSTSIGSVGSTVTEASLTDCRVLTDAAQSAAVENDQPQRQETELRIQRVKEMTKIAHATPNKLGEALHKAIVEGRLADVQHLLKSGADVNYINGVGRPPLQSALISIPRQDAVALLLERGADVNAINFCGTTALHCVAGSDRSGRCVDLLVAAGGDVNARSGAGATPLHWAANADNEAAVRALLSAGARKDLMAWDGSWKNKAPFDLAKSLKIRVLLVS